MNIWDNLVWKYLNQPEFQNAFFGKLYKNGTEQEVRCL